MSISISGFVFFSLNVPFMLFDGLNKLIHSEYTNAVLRLRFTNIDTDIVCMAITLDLHVLIRPWSVTCYQST